MSILFSCLSDLASFLRIRDDTDFERILSKEVVSEKAFILRILGTFSITENYETLSLEKDVHHNTSTASISTSLATESVSATSERIQTITIFVGTSPVRFDVNPIPVSSSSAVRREDNTFLSTIFQQDCKHFCNLQKCFRTQWKSKNICSKLAVDCEFHLDGTVPEDKLKQYFVLTWKRQPSPSFSKWTRDVQDVGNNSPGTLRLNLPAIYLNSSRNVTSIVGLLDKHIETFMRVRSEIHRFSSFK